LAVEDPSFPQLAQPSLEEHPSYHGLNQPTPQLPKK